jgi:hypothetical protein
MCNEILNLGMKSPKSDVTMPFKNFHVITVPEEGESTELIYCFPLYPFHLRTYWFFVLRVDFPTQDHGYF